MPKIRPTDQGSYLLECPGCKMLHVVYVTTPGRPHWTFNGDVDKPTFTPSLLVKWGQGRFDPGGPKEHVCHSFITDGTVQFLGDCTHELANQTVDLPNWED